MLNNSRGNNILLNTGAFRGPPIVCCSADYTTPFNAAAWTNLLLLATQLDVPAFHIDQAHDGGSATLLTKLQNIQRFYSGQATDPWIHSSGSDNTAYPPSGPIFYFDINSANPSTDTPGSGAYIADQFSRACVNYRRNHLYEHAMDSIWPIFGENLDRIQRPPIHALKAEFASDPTWFTRVVYQQWLSGAVATNYLADMRAGFDELALREASYPGISRHILPTMAISTLPFIYPWS